jgi:hypothetical protein
LALGRGVFVFRASDEERTGDDQKSCGSHARNLEKPASGRK